MTGWSKEMQDALRADAEKLSQLTGEDHSVEFFDFDDGYDDEDEPDREHDCGLMDDGQCMLAGTEWCDFECHNRDSELFAGSAAWCRKHGKGGTP